MSDDEENQQLARAMALSLQGLEAKLTREEQEKADLKLAIALSLGKPVDQLTARDMLFADTHPPAVSQKRPREDASTGQHRVLKRIDHSLSQFWEGTVKLSYVQGFIGPDYIRFKDIVQKVKLH